MAGLGPVPHPIVEGLIDLLLELARTRLSVDHDPALVVRELVIRGPHDVHVDTGRNKGARSSVRQTGIANLNHAKRMDASPSGF